MGALAVRNIAFNKFMKSAFCAFSTTVVFIRYSYRIRLCSPRIFWCVVFVFCFLCSQNSKLTAVLLTS